MNQISPIHSARSMPFFRSFLMILMFCCLLPVNSQQLMVSSGKGVVYSKYENRVDWLVMMYGIDAASELKMVLPDDSLTVSWFRYADGSTTPMSAPGNARQKLRLMSNQTVISPDDHTGYIARIEGTVNGKAYLREMSVWVIDYKLYEPALTKMIPAAPVKGACDLLELSLQGLMPDMTYQTVNGLQYSLKREFELKYESLEWDDEWKTINMSQDITLSSMTIQVNDPPYKDTYFTLSGDQFAADLALAPFTVSSDMYQAVRVIAKLGTEATLRTEKNEGDRPDIITTVSGSAPLELNFLARANEPVATYYYWTITRGGEVILTRTEENHLYTFRESGTYLVKLRAENAWCSYEDSVTVKVSESAMYAPNVFTPNGDGINDEFRVAYKSIVEFKATIFNRWGVKIFEWTDPQKGWDGTYNGRNVSEGPYFYVIRGRGSDGQEYLLKGDINLLRGKQ